ncbi:MAG: molybdopterin-binding protein [Acidobacteriota bacterium]|nr:molybdopterin-binding protein [Acidobacteriota bacterium]MDH3785311.1 molybdopterin-binding protein [Acidobacteriota bacterium]
MLSDDANLPSRRVEPMAFEVILVGEDLLAGDVRDDHLRSLASFARQHGAIIRRATIVPYDLKAVRDAIAEAESRKPELVVVTGGLGPARRDCTLEAVSDVYGRPLSSAPLAHRWVDDAYTRLSHKGVVGSAAMNITRDKLCQIPVGSQPLKNEIGVANGIWLRLAGRPALLCLPGMPRESEAMLAEVTESIRELRPRHYVVRREIESPTTDEAALQPLIEKLAREFPEVRFQTRPIASARKGANVRVIFESHGRSEAETNGLVGDAIRRLIALQSGS